MRWRKSNYKTWEEIRNELPNVIRKIEEGWTHWFDLHQSFDDSRDYALVVGYNVEGELAIVIASESSDSAMHEYGYDWEIPITDDNGTCWDTEQIVSKEDADRPDFMDMIVDEFQNEWLAIVAYFTRKNCLEKELK